MSKARKNNPTPQERARRLLKRLIGKKKFDQYMKTGEFSVRGKSGATWYFGKSKNAKITCHHFSKHHVRLCQGFTGNIKLANPRFYTSIKRSIPDDDLPIIMFLAVKRGIEGERELYRTSGKGMFDARPSCVKCQAIIKKIVAKQTPKKKAPNRKTIRKRRD